MNIRRADGSEIEGRKQHSAHQSVAEVFGLEGDALPTEAEIENVLAGRRADGTAPRGPESTAAASTMHSACRACATSN